MLELLPAFQQNIIIKCGHISSSLRLPTGPSDGLASLFGRQRLSQKFGADFGAGAKRMRSGDEEMPARPALAERRAKFDAVAARRAASAGGWLGCWV